MENVIARLRASKQAPPAEQGADAAGSEAGRRWAMQQASYGELKRVAELDLVENGAGLPFAIVRALGGGHDYEAFWSGRTRGGRVTDEFAEGFVRGARSVWNEVADEV